MQFIERRIPQDAHAALNAAGLPPLLARLYAARGVKSAAETQAQLKDLLPFSQLNHCETMAEVLAQAIKKQEKITIIADYDADGATACACAVRGLRLFGARVDFLVPNRFEYGYGLTPPIVDLACAKAEKPDILLTVDNGIASIEGVDYAKSLGLRVLITDHHLPGGQIPDALIVNPTMPDCAFPSRHLAGVGVIFYVLLALRANLRAKGEFAQKQEPNLAQLLDLVALGTVADLVPLDQNNRILVAHGLARMRAGRVSRGIAALFKQSRRDIQRATAADLGFAIAPRLNAAGRMDDMTLGITCLLSDDAAQAENLAHTLDELNRTRRAVESSMQMEAQADLSVFLNEDQLTITAFRDDWHQGVVGIVAARLREKVHRPVFVFAPSDEGEIRGSGRSIEGFHLRDALDSISRDEPDLLLRFGGHAAAAGVTIREGDLDRFKQAFEKIASERLNAHILERKIEIDGKLEDEAHCAETAELINQHVWGQAFPAPLFADDFAVITQKIVGERHLKLSLRRGEQIFDAIYFGRSEFLPEFGRFAYRLTVNEYQARRQVQLQIEYWLPC